jgi:hypothetical protein
VDRARSRRRRRPAGARVRVEPRLDSQHLGTRGCADLLRRSRDDPPRPGRRRRPRCRARAGPAGRSRQGARPRDRGSEPRARALASGPRRLGRRGRP